MDFLDDVLDDEAEASAAPASDQGAAAPSPEAQAPAEGAQGQPRDPHGRFAARPGEEAPGATPAPDTASTAGQGAADPAPAEDPKWAEMRRQYEEQGRQIAGLQKALTASRADAREKRQAPALPDYWSEEDKRVAQQLQEHYSQENNERVLAITFQASRRIAETVHGKEAVEALAAWAGERTNPDNPLFDQALNDRLLASPDPYELLREAQQQDQLDSALRDPSKRARLLALLDEATPAAAAQPGPASALTSPQSPLPPKSLASQVSAGSAKPGDVPTYPGSAFDAEFH